MENAVLELELEKEHMLQHLKVILDEIDDSKREIERTRFGGCGTCICQKDNCGLEEEDPCEDDCVCPA